MEYVKKKEVKPYRKEFSEKIELVREEVREEGITFTYVLVGSAKRNLVVRHHNKGFDCDYRIEIKKNKEDIKAKEMKEIFMRAFDKAFEDTEFKPCENSTSAITIKKVDKNDSKIIFGYDIVIVKVKDDDFEILRNLKDGTYKFEKLPESKNHMEKVKDIKGKDMWKDVRDIYLEKKEKNENAEEPKKSFQLFVETINEVLQ